MDPCANREKKKNRTDFWNDIISKYEAHNSELVQKQSELRRRVESIEFSMPALFCFNMTQTTLSEPDRKLIDVVTQIHNGSSSGNVNANQMQRRTRSDFDSRPVKDPDGMFANENLRKFDQTSSVCTCNTKQSSNLSTPVNTQTSKDLDSTICQCDAGAGGTRQTRNVSDDAPDCTCAILGTGSSVSSNLTNRDQLCDCNSPGPSLLTPKKYDPNQSLNSQASSIDNPNFDDEQTLNTKPSFCDCEHCHFFNEPSDTGSTSCPCDPCPSPSSESYKEAPSSQSIPYSAEDNISGQDKRDGVSDQDKFSNEVILATHFERIECECQTSLQDSTAPKINPVASANRNSTCTDCPDAQKITTSNFTSTKTSDVSCICNLDTEIVTQTTSKQVDTFNMEYVSSVSVTTEDADCIEKIKCLVQTERNLKHDIDELRHKEDAYVKTLKHTDDMWKAEDTGVSDAQNLRNWNRELQRRNVYLQNELRRAERELKQMRKNFEQPIRRQLVQERERRQKLEAEHRKLTSNQFSKKSSYNDEIDFLTKQLQSANQNLNDLNLVNKRLKEELCVLNYKAEELQTDLINQKLSEIHTVSRLTAMEQMQPLPRTDDEIWASGEGGSKEDLSTIARNLSNLLAEAEQCSKCKTIPSNLIETIRCIKSLVDLVTPVKSEPDTGKPCTCRESKEQERRLRKPISEMEESKPSSEIEESKRTFEIYPPKQIESSLSHVEIMPEEERPSAATIYERPPSKQMFIVKSSVRDETEEVIEQPIVLPPISYVEQLEPVVEDTMRNRDLFEEIIEFDRKKVEPSRDEVELGVQKLKVKKEIPVEKKSPLLEPLEESLRDEVGEISPPLEPLEESLRDEVGEISQPLEESLRDEVGEISPPLEPLEESLRDEVELDVEELEVKDEIPAEEISPPLQPLEESLRDEVELGVEELKVKDEIPVDEISRPLQPLEEFPEDLISTCEIEKEFIQAVVNHVICKCRPELRGPCTCEPLFGKDEEDVYVTRSIASAGVLEVVTEGPAGVIGTTLKLTDSGKVEVITEVTEYEEEEEEEDINKEVQLPEEESAIEIIRDDDQLKEVAEEKRVGSKEKELVIEKTEGVLEGDLEEVAAVADTIEAEEQSERDEEETPTPRGISAEILKDLIVREISKEAQEEEQPLTIETVKGVLKRDLGDMVEASTVKDEEKLRDFDEELAPPRISTEVLEGLLIKDISEKLKPEDKELSIEKIEGVLETDLGDILEASAITDTAKIKDQPERVEEEVVTPRGKVKEQLEREDEEALTPRGISTEVLKDLIVREISKEEQPVTIKTVKGVLKRDLGDMVEAATVKDEEKLRDIEELAPARISTEVLEDLIVRDISEKVKPKGKELPIEKIEDVLESDLGDILEASAITETAKIKDQSERVEVEVVTPRGKVKEQIQREDEEVVAPRDKVKEELQREDEEVVTPRGKVKEQLEREDEEALTPRGISTEVLKDLIVREISKEEQPVTIKTVKGVLKRDLGDMVEAATVKDEDKLREIEDLAPARISTEVLEDLLVRDISEKVKPKGEELPIEKIEDVLESDLGDILETAAVTEIVMVEEKPQPKHTTEKLKLEGEGEETEVAIGISTEVLKDLIVREVSKEVQEEEEPIKIETVKGVLKRDLGSMVEEATVKDVEKLREMGEDLIPAGVSPDVLEDLLIEDITEKMESEDAELTLKMLKDLLRKDLEDLLDAALIIDIVMPPEEKGKEVLPGISPAVLTDLLITDIDKEVTSEEELTIEDIRDILRRNLSELIEAATIRDAEKLREITEELVPAGVSPEVLEGLIVEDIAEKMKSEDVELTIEMIKDLIRQDLEDLLIAALIADVVKLKGEVLVEVPVGVSTEALGDLLIKDISKEIRETDEEVTIEMIQDILKRKLSDLVEAAMVKELIPLKEREQVEIVVSTDVLRDSLIKDITKRLPSEEENLTMEIIRDAIKEDLRQMLEAAITEMIPDIPTPEIEKPVVFSRIMKAESKLKRKLKTKTSTIKAVSSSFVYKRDKRYKLDDGISIHSQTVAVVDEIVQVEEIVFEEEEIEQSIITLEPSEVLVPLVEPELEVVPEPEEIPEPEIVPVPKSPSVISEGETRKILSEVIDSIMTEKYMEIQKLGLCLCRKESEERRLIEEAFQSGEEDDSYLIECIISEAIDQATRAIRESRSAEAQISREFKICTCDEEETSVPEIQSICTCTDSIETKSEIISTAKDEALICTCSKETQLDEPTQAKIGVAIPEEGEGIIEEEVKKITKSEDEGYLPAICTCSENIQCGKLTQTEDLKDEDSDLFACAEGIGKVKKVDKKEGVQGYLPSTCICVKASQMDENICTCFEITECEDTGVVASEKQIRPEVSDRVSATDQKTAEMQGPDYTSISKEVQYEREQIEMQETYTSTKEISIKQSTEDKQVSKQGSLASICVCAKRAQLDGKIPDRIGVDKSCEIRECLKDEQLGKPCLMLTKATEFGSTGKKQDVVCQYEKDQERKMDVSSQYEKKEQIIKVTETGTTTESYVETIEVAVPTSDIRVSEEEAEARRFTDVHISKATEVQSFTKSETSSYREAVSKTQKIPRGIHLDVHEVKEVHVSDVQSLSDKFRSETSSYKDEDVNKAQERRGTNLDVYQIEDLYISQASEVRSVVSKAKSETSSYKEEVASKTEKMKSEDKIGDPSKEAEPSSTEEKRRSPLFHDTIAKGLDVVRNFLKSDDKDSSKETDPSLTHQREGDMDLPHVKDAYKSQTTEVRSVTSKAKSETSSYKEEIVRKTQKSPTGIDTDAHQVKDVHIQSTGTDVQTIVDKTTELQDKTGQTQESLRKLKEAECYTDKPGKTVCECPDILKALKTVYKSKNKRSRKADRDKQNICLCNKQQSSPDVITLVKAKVCTHEKRPTHDYKRGLMYYAVEATKKKEMICDCGRIRDGKKLVYDPIRRVCVNGPTQISSQRSSITEDQSSTEDESEEVTESTSSDSSTSSSSSEDSSRKPNKNIVRATQGKVRDCSCTPRSKTRPPNLSSNATQTSKPVKQKTKSINQKSSQTDNKKLASNSLPNNASLRNTCRNAGIQESKASQPKRNRNRTCSSTYTKQCSKNVTSSKSSQLNNKGAYSETTSSHYEKRWYREIKYFPDEEVRIDHSKNIQRPIETTVDKSVQPEVKPIEQKVNDISRSKEERITDVIPPDETPRKKDASTVSAPTYSITETVVPPPHKSVSISLIEPQEKSVDKTVDTSKEADPPSTEQKRRSPIFHDTIAKGLDIIRSSFQKSDDNIADTSKETESVSAQQKGKSDDKIAEAEISSTEQKGKSFTLRDTLSRGLNAIRSFRKSDDKIKGTSKETLAQPKRQSDDKIEDPSKEPVPSSAQQKIKSDDKIVEASKESAPSPARQEKKSDDKIVDISGETETSSGLNAIKNFPKPVDKIKESAADDFKGRVKCTTEKLGADESAKCNAVEFSQIPPTGAPRPAGICTRRTCQRHLESSAELIKPAAGKRSSEKVDKFESYTSHELQKPKTSSSCTPGTCKDYATRASYKASLSAPAVSKPSPMSPSQDKLTPKQSASPRKAASGVSTYVTPSTTPTASETPKTKIPMPTTCSIGSCAQKPQLNTLGEGIHKIPDSQKNVASNLSNLEDPVVVEDVRSSKGEKSPRGESTAEELVQVRPAVESAPAPASRPGGICTPGTCQRHVESSTESTKQAAGQRSSEKVDKVEPYIRDELQKPKSSSCTPGTCKDYETRASYKASLSAPPVSKRSPMSPSQDKLTPKQSASPKDAASRVSTYVTPSTTPTASETPKTKIPMPTTCSMESCPQKSQLNALPCTRQTCSRKSVAAERSKSFGHSSVQDTNLDKNQFGACTLETCQRLPSKLGLESTISPTTKIPVPRKSSVTCTCVPCVCPKKTQNAGKAQSDVCSPEICAMPAPQISQEFQGCTSETCSLRTDSSSSECSCRRKGKEEMKSSSDSKSKDDLVYSESKRNDILVYTCPCCSCRCLEEDSDVTIDSGLSPCTSKTCKMNHLLQSSLPSSKVFAVINEAGEPPCTCRISPQKSEDSSVLSMCSSCMCKATIMAESPGVAPCSSKICTDILKARKLSPCTSTTCLKKIHDILPYRSKIDAESNTQEFVPCSTATCPTKLIQTNKLAPCSPETCAKRYKGILPPKQEVKATADLAETSPQLKDLDLRSSDITTRELGSTFNVSLGSRPSSIASHIVEPCPPTCTKFLQDSEPHTQEDVSSDTKSSKIKYRQTLANAFHITPEDFKDGVGLGASDFITVSPRNIGEVTSSSIQSEISGSGASAEAEVLRKKLMKPEQKDTNEVIDIFLDSKDDVQTSTPYLSDGIRDLSNTKQATFKEKESGTIKEDIPSDRRRSSEVKKCRRSKQSIEDHKVRKETSNKVIDNPENSSPTQEQNFNQNITLEKEPDKIQQTLTEKTKMSPKSGNPNNYNPNNPNNLGNPGNLGNPNIPVNAGMSNNVSNLGNPGNLNTPSNLAKPNIASILGNPGNLNNSSNLDKPNTASVPGNPGSLNKPSNPDKSNIASIPGNPGNPNNPSNIDKPNISSVPGNPGSLNKPSNPDKPNTASNFGNLSNLNNSSNLDNPDSLNNPGHLGKSDIPNNFGNPASLSNPSNFGGSNSPKGLGNPGSLNNPSNLGKSDIPSNLGNPGSLNNLSNFAGSNNPKGLDNPGSLNNPSNLGNPHNPSNFADSNTPKGLGNPGSLNNPSNLGKSDIPSNPGNPDSLNNPSNFTGSNSPSNPGNPGSLNNSSNFAGSNIPSNPGNPGSLTTPSNLDKSNVPSTFNNPSNLGKPASNISIAGSHHNPGNVTGSNIPSNLGNPGSLITPSNLGQSNVSGSLGNPSNFNNPSNLGATNNPGNPNKPNYSGNPENNPANIEPSGMVQDYQVANYPADDEEKFKQNDKTDEENKRREEMRGAPDNSNAKSNQSQTRKATEASKENRQDTVSDDESICASCGRKTPKLDDQRSLVESADTKKRHPKGCDCIECLLADCDRECNIEEHPPDCDCIDCLCNPCGTDRRVQDGLLDVQAIKKECKHTPDCECLDCLCDPCVRSDGVAAEESLKETSDHLSDCDCIDCLCEPCGSCLETPSVSLAREEHPSLCVCEECRCQPVSRICTCCKCIPCPHFPQKTVSQHPPDCQCVECLCDPCKNMAKARHPPGCDCPDCVCSACEDVMADCDCELCDCDICPDEKVHDDPKRQLKQKHSSSCTCVDCLVKPQKHERKSSLPPNPIETTTEVPSGFFSGLLSNANPVTGTTSLSQLIKEFISKTLSQPLPPLPLPPRKLKTILPDCKCHPECICEECTAKRKSGECGCHPQCICESCTKIRRATKEAPCICEVSPRKVEACGCHPKCICEDCMAKRQAGVDECDCHPDCMCEECETKRKEGLELCDCEPECLCEDCDVECESEEEKSVSSPKCVCSDIIAKLNEKEEECDCLPVCQCEDCKKRAATVAEHNQSPVDSQSSEGEKSTSSSKCVCSSIRAKRNEKEEECDCVSVCQCEDCIKRPETVATEDESIISSEDVCDDEKKVECDCLPDCQCDDCKKRADADTIQSHSTVESQSEEDESIPSSECVCRSSDSKLDEKKDECDCLPVCKCEDCKKLAAKRDQSEDLQNQLRNVEDENERKQHEIQELQALMNQIKCSCTDAEIQAVCTSFPDVTNRPNDVEGLQAALSMLQKKCESKDRMIEAMTQELKLRATSNVFSDMLKKISSKQQPKADFDRQEICNTLPRPTNDPRFGRPGHRLAQPVRDDCGCSYTNESLAMKICNVKRISPSSLLVKWTAPTSNLVMGYEVCVNGVLKSRVHSAARTAAVVFTYEVRNQISVYAVTQFGRCEPPAVASFNV